MYESQQNATIKQVCSVIARDNLLSFAKLNLSKIEGPDL
jgi:hypothetical protein